MSQALRTVDRFMHRIMLIVADIAIVAMVTIVTMTAVLRFFHMGIGWAEEVPRLLVGLFAFLALAMGTRDHLHVSVSVIFNLFPKGGAVQKCLNYLSDFIVLLCGAFMLYFGAARCIKLYPLPGHLPMTGLGNWIQYLPIAVSGFMVVFDSVLHLTGVLKPDDLLFEDSEEEVSA